MDLDPPLLHPTVVDGVRYELMSSPPDEPISLTAVLFQASFRFRSYHDHLPVVAIRILEGVLVIPQATIIDSIRLVHLAFDPRCGLIEIDGFEGCGFESITLPDSIRRIGDRAFLDCVRLHRLQFAADTTIAYFDEFTGTPALRWLRYPHELVSLGWKAFRRFYREERQPMSPRRILLLFEEHRMSTHRRHLAMQLAKAPSHQGQNENDFRGDVFEITDSAPALSANMEDESFLNTLARLPRLRFGDPQFSKSLVLKFRIREDYTSRRGHVKKFIPMREIKEKNPIARCSLDSVISMFAIGPNFHCTHVKRRSPQSPFSFRIHCLECGDGSLIHLDCPADASSVVVSTRKCCGHFFLGRMPAADPRSMSLFVTAPDISADHQYESSHPLRAIARALLKAEALAIGHRVLLQGWVEAAAPVHHGLPMWSRVKCLGDVLAHIHGNIWIEYHPDFPRVLEYEGQGLVSLIWLAPWAVNVLHAAQSYELDCSFEALPPYTYCIPLAVRANRGIPLGISIGPTERQEIYTRFADHLIENGILRDELRRIPLFSDEGTALKAYAGIYHQFHFYCYRHLMEALGSATLAAMLAHRLFFTFTEREFMEVVDQTVSDFDAGCSLGFITINAAKKFRSIFGISADGRVELRVFRAQALWGERGRGYGVSTCTNHIEGLHGRLNAVTRGMASPAKRLGRIVQIITASAGDWSERVAKGRHKALLRQAERAARESASDDQCHRPECDGGLIFAKRYDMEQFPCPHIQVEVPKLEDLRPEQFELNDSGAPVIVAQTHNPEGPAWTLPIRRYHAPNGKIGLADPATGACGEHERFVVRLRAELQYLNHSKEFPYSVGEMLFRLGQIHGPEMRTPGEIKEANTAFLMECVEIVQKTREW